MKSIVTGKQMQLLDRRTTEHFGIPSGILMEQASIAFVRELFLLLQETDLHKVLVAAGKGNNGGDGIAVARLLNQMGYHTDLYLLEDILPDQAGSSLHELQTHIYRQYGYPEIRCLNDLQDDYSLVIDAVFGVGLSRKLSPLYETLLEKLNTMHAVKAAVDIPSGVSADTGECMGTAFRADWTITFSFAKTGMYLWPGSEKCGRIVVVPIGITSDSFFHDRPAACALEKDDLIPLLAARSPHSNKGSYGKLLIIAGCRNMAGAAAFCAKAAYRSGCGLVRILTHETNRIILQSLIPEAILDTYGDGEVTMQLPSLLAWADCVAMGPGMGQSKQAEEIVSYVLQNSKLPMLLDADALNICSRDLTLLEKTSGIRIITPHPGEMSRLTGMSIAQIQADPIGIARSFADRYGLVCVLKDQHTVTAVYGCETVYLNLTGNDGLACGGSGDVLSGVIASLLVQKAKSAEMLSLAEAGQQAAAGVYIHGAAADCVLPHTGSRGMIASDVIEGLSMVWKELA